MLPVSKALLERPSDKPTNDREVVRTVIEKHLESALVAFCAGVMRPDPTKLSCLWVSHSPEGFRTEDRDGEPPKKFFQHQREGVGLMFEILKAGYPGCCLADEMGLGKTIQTIAFLAVAKIRYDHRLVKKWVTQTQKDLTPI